MESDHSLLNKTPYHITHPGDTEEIRKDAAKKEMRYPPLFMDHFSKGKCLLCEDSPKFSVTIQVHKSFKPNKLHIIIEKGGDYPIFEVYVCKNHTKAKSFSEFRNPDSPDKSYLILGSRALPKNENHSEIVSMTLTAPHSDKYAQCSNGKVGLNRTECDCGCFVGLYAFKGQEQMTMTVENEVIRESINGSYHKGIITSVGN